MGFLTKYGTIWGQIPLTTGRVFFVGGSSYTIEGRAYSGSDNNDGLSPERALATVDYATGLCTANVGDCVVMLQSYTETGAAAGFWTCDVAGVRYIGLGQGATRPLITFSATSSTILVTAANVTFENFVVTPSVNSVVTAFAVQAADCTIGTLIAPVVVRDATDSIEFVRGILTTAAGDRLSTDLKYEGRNGGSVGVNAVRLVGTDGARIKVDFYGKASTSVVEFVTTACTDVHVTGIMYNSSSTTGAKAVVDTVTGSVWSANWFDSGAGVPFYGGSTVAISSQSVFANITVGSPDATTNARERDVVGNKTDTAVYVPGTTKSNAAYAKGTADLQERVALKAAATITNGQTLFTVAGGPIIVIGLASICATTNDGTASTLQYSATPTSGSPQTISAASGSLAAAAAGASVTLAGTALSTAALLNANGPNLIANPGTVLVPAGTITAVVGVGSTTGTWAHYLRYRPLATGVTVS